MDTPKRIKRLTSGDISLDLEFRTEEIDGKPLEKRLPAQEFDAVALLMSARGEKLTPKQLLPTSNAGDVLLAARVVMKKANTHLLGRLDRHIDHIIRTESVAEGYRWIDAVEIEYADAVPQLIASPPVTKVTVFPVIPRIGTEGYFLSNVSTGNADSCKVAREFSTRENRWIDTIPVIRDGTPALRLEFSHLNSADPDECWWSAVVGLDQDRSYADWLPVDLTGYQKLTIEARALFPEGAERVPLLVRLEDATADGTAGSYHHSTNWAEVWVTPEFASRAIPFSQFRRDQWAWWWNRHEVDFGIMLQITFGHDNSIPTTSGIFDVRSITIE